MHWSSLFFFLALRLSFFLLGIKALCLLCCSASRGVHALFFARFPPLSSHHCFFFPFLLDCILGCCVYLPSIESPSLTIVLSLSFLFVAMHPKGAYFFPLYQISPSLSGHHFLSLFSLSLFPLFLPITLFFLGISFFIIEAFSLLRIIFSPQHWSFLSP